MDDKRPAFQYYPQDYLSDVNVQAMTWEERGRYWHLVSMCWVEGSIPSDKVLIRRLLGGSNDLSSDSLDFILKCFKNGPEEGTLVHPRLEKERIKQDNYKKGCSAGGRESQRRRKANKVVASTSKAPTNTSSSSLSSSSSSKRQVTPTPLANTLFEEDWKAYPKGGNKKCALRNYKRTVTTPETRKLFLEAMKAYVASVDDPKYLKLGETFFNQWQDLEISEPVERMSENERINAELVAEYAKKGE